MELCQTETLDTYIQKCNIDGTLEKEQFKLLTWFYQLCTAVDYIHDQGYSHRYIRPSNVLFSKNGDVKLGDFGLTSASANVPYFKVPYQRNDSDDYLVGNDLYASPEQLPNYKKKSTNQMDIFPLGT